jgi:hypothetical protein
LADRANLENGMSPKNDTQIRKYTFGPLQFSVRGLGVFVGCDKLSERIATLSPAELRQANREAWRQRNSATRVANRQANVSVYGWDDARDQLIEVATFVCRETWKRIPR